MRLTINGYRASKKYKEGLYGCLGTNVYIGVVDVLQIRIDGLYKKYNVGIW